MQKIGTINICNVPYTVILYKDQYKEINKAMRDRNERYRLDDEEEEKKNAIDGYCDYSTKEIHVFTDDNTNEYYFKQTMLHEISHAFLYEIGYAHHGDEEFIDKISKWVPQIYNIFNEGMKCYDKSIKKSSGKKKN